MSIRGTILPLALLLVLPSIIQDALTEPRGDNVCTRTRTRKTEKRVNEHKNIEVKYQGLCAGFITCTKTRYETIVDSKLVPVYEDVPTVTCCPGYAETPDNYCAPVCLRSCNNGQCVKPGVCKCNPEPTETSPGYKGSFCNRFVCLSHDRWGSKCDLECNCNNPNSYCSASTGKCLCLAGWRGANCTEECTPSMNCADVVLPPILEPEANIFLDNTIQSQRLEAIDAGALGRDASTTDDPGSRSIASLVAAHMGLNLMLIVLTFGLAFALFCYRRKLNKMRQELYYAAPYSTSSSSASGSTYTNPSLPPTGNRMNNRPRIPTPLEESFLGKNMSFAQATREILGKGPSMDISGRTKCIVDQKVESHLISSQKSSTRNVYSDVESVLCDKSLTLDQLGALPDKFPQAPPTDDSLYQVPRSTGALLQNVSVDLSDRSQSNADQTISFYAEGANSDQMNIYEEIKPRSTSQ